MNETQTFAEREQTRAVAWKMRTATLPDEARQAGIFALRKDGTDGPPHEFCLPRQHADLNLLPEVRETTLTLFAALDIPWHAALDVGHPGTHLLSSQVQCVNALGQMVTDPARIVRAFGPALGTAEVHQIEPGRWLTFEYIGEDDLLNEAVRGVRRRGTHCTSVDAAFLHTTTDGVRELILLEWKYTESYDKRVPDEKKDATRRARYSAMLADPNGPIDMDLLPFDELLQEPFYQLMRQQLLAYRLERTGGYGVDRVRVVHVLPADNAAYRHSLHGEVASTLGADVGAVWKRLLRRPDRFVSLDHSLFSDPEVTSAEYVDRYFASSSPADQGHPARSAT